MVSSVSQMFVFQSLGYNLIQVRFCSKTPCTCKYKFALHSVSLSLFWVPPTSSFISCPCLYRLFLLSFFIFQLSFMSFACISFTVFLSLNALSMSLAYSAQVPRFFCPCPSIILSLSLAYYVPVPCLPSPCHSFTLSSITLSMSLLYPVLVSCLKVLKNENFFGFDFEFCTISLLVMSKLRFCKKTF